MKNLFSYYSLRNLSALCALAFSANSMALDLNVVTLNKLSETRIDRTTYDYVFSVTVQNGAQAVNNAAQTLTASGAGTTILDGSVLLGNLASGEQITPADTIKIRHNRALPFNQSALVWYASGTLVASSSSAASSVANLALLNEPFNVDKATLFSAAYRSISTDTSAPLFFVTGGNSGITIANNELTLAAARFTIGNKPPRANTAASDTSANGEFDLSRPYRISFRVVAASGSGALQIMVDNNSTSAGNSLHGSASRIFNASANSLVAGQIIELLPTVGTANSFISLRTESSASVTIDDLVIEYLGGAVTSSAAPSSIAASSIPASSKSSTPLSSSVATSINTSSSVVASVAPSSTATSQSSSSVASYNGALRPAKMEGFAAHAGVTGGQGGAVVTVTTGTQLNAALCARATMSTPITILVNGTISHANTTAQGCNTQADVIEIKQMSNVSIIGVGTNALFEEIGIHVREASNIILQNLHVRNVKKSGSPTSNGGDAIGMETNVDRVWIDHNHLEASGGEKDGYDSLLDMKAGVTNVTVSYNLYNDSSRAGLIGSSDSDDKNTNITFHHNWYKNIEQRTPLIRHALVHMYNNYWSNDRIDYMFHAINSRMNAKALVESNYFYNVNNPLIASDDSSVAGCWQTNNENTVLPSIYYSRTVGNGALVIPEVVDGQLQSTCSVTVPYTVEMDHSSTVPEIVMANVGVGKIANAIDGSSSSSNTVSSIAVSSVTASSIASSTAVSSVASSVIVIPASSSSVASSEAQSSEEQTSEASSSASSTNNNSLLISETFSVDKTTLFSAAHKSISTDASAALYFITGGGSGITVTNNELSIAGGRLTIGNRPPRASTTASDINANGDFDLSRPYRISFTVVAASGSGKVQVYIDNNTTSAGNSIHGANSKVFEAVASSLTAGQQIQITPTIGTATSFIALRAESSATVVIDNLQVEYTDGAGVSSSSVSSTIASSQASSSSSLVLSSSSSINSSAITSSAISSSISSSSSSAPYIPVDVNLSADCINLATNPNVNWRDTALQTDQEIVECLYKTLGTPVGYGENAKGGYDPNGNSKLTIITKNSSTSVEQQVLDAISGEAHNWIVFDKIQFAQPTEIGMYRLGCSNATVQSILGATEAECVNYQQWCAKNSVSESACVTTFFNTAMNKSNNPIRNPVIGSNKSIDGRGSEAHFLFSGFAIGRDSTGLPTQTATSVILTHLNFKGAGHTEDHYVDPDMIRSTGASHDIWIHKNTFDTTGDSAFDVKVGAYGITMSFNEILDVKRATLHSSSDSHTIDAQIRTTMHHNLFVTRDASYMALGNTLRRVPLIRRGTSHMLNNVFVNYRKDLLSIRVGASILQQDNMFVVNRIHQEKADLAASLTELQTNLIRDVTGGNYRGEGNFVWFGDAACNLDETTKTGFTISSGTVANLAANYSTASQATLNHWRFAAGQELVDYLSATAGKYGQAPFNSPLAGDKYYVLGLGKVSCQ